MPEIRTVKIDGQDWLVLLDVLTSVGRDRAMSNPMFVARIPEAERQQIRLFNRWTWLVTEFGADWAAGQDWREHGDPAVYSLDRAATRAYVEHGPELYDAPKIERKSMPPRSSSIPTYQQVADDLREKIQTGELQPGDKVPTVRATADEHGVTSGTVSRGYQLLMDEGLIWCSGGRSGGYHVKEADRG